jgi:hypothetical protein
MGVHIQLLGLIGSGKTRLATSLAQAIGGHVLPFAKEVYRLADLVAGRPINKADRLDRELLKLIGTTWGRQSVRPPGDLGSKLDALKPPEWGSEDIWAQRFVSECRQLPADASIINDDTRFPNELRIAMSAMGFTPVFVKCAESTRKRRLRERGDNFDPNDREHQSEAMTNGLNDLVLASFCVPVVWNDSDFNKPDLPWVYASDEFHALVVNCRSDSVLRGRLKWDDDKSSQLLKIVGGINVGVGTSYANG